MASDQSKIQHPQKKEQPRIDESMDIREVVLQMEREYYKQQEEETNIIELKRRHSLLKLLR